MMNIMRDPMWQFIGASFAFITIVLSIILFFVSEGTKKTCL